MKRILTLILLFTITLYSIPTQAFTLDGNDIPLVQTKNLFDKDTAITGFFIASNGSVDVSITSFIHPDFLPIEAGQIITLSANTNTALRIAFYDSAKNFIIREANFTSILTRTAPANTKFFRVSGTNSELNSFQTERGNTATSYAPFGFLTLNEIFDDGNLRSSFENSRPDQVTYTNNNGTWTQTAGFDIFKSTFSVALNNKGYLRTSNNQTNFNFAIRNNTASVTYFSSTLTNQNFNFIQNFSEATSNFTLRHTSSATGIKDFDFELYLDLNALGIDHLTIGQLDRLYDKWENTNSFIEGFAAGFPEGFDDGFADGLIEGFDNGVASETSFAVGFAQGLSEGQDMETGSSLLILIVALIGFGMMIFGFITKRGIFNLLSVAAFIVLGGLLAEFIGFIIITFALVFINVYYAFFGDL